MRSKYSDIIKTGKVKLPKKIIIEATLRCNLSCNFCMRDKIKYKEIKLKEIQKMIDNFGPSIKAVGLTGGEVFLREDIFDILDLLSEKKYSIGILSNATLINKRIIKKLNKYKNISIGTSIDGLEKNHDQIRGPKSFQKTLKTIKAIDKKIPIGVTTVITKENINEITTLFKQIAPYINCYNVQFEIFNNKKEIEESAKLLEIKKQKIVTWINKRPNYDYSENAIAKIIKELRELSKKYKVRFVTEPILAESHLNDFFNGNILTKQPLCNHIFSARADSRGNLVFCHLIKEKFGNLIETPLPKLWNSGPIKKVRKNLFKNMPPLCKRCCRIVEHPPIYDTPSTQL